MPKVYDCFTFFNELDLLEIRLNELYDVVDHFVIVEATRTFQKKPKPLYFSENRNRFSKFENKIIHIVVDQFPNFFYKFRVPKTWDYENSQREYILKGLVGAGPSDRVIVSDVDEIPSKNSVLEAKNISKPCVFEQYLCFYYINNVCTHYGHGNAILNREGFGYWRGPVMLNKSEIKTVKATRLLRDCKTDDVQVLTKSGWHFSFLGGTDHIIKKIESWSHAEFNNEKIKNREYIETSIRSGKSIFEPDSKFKLFDVQGSAVQFPLTVKAHPDKYKSLLLEL